MNANRLIWIGIPVLNTLFQIFIKLAAQQALDFRSASDWLLHTMSSPWMLAAIVVEIVTFFIWMRVLSELDLAKAFPLSAISYVLVLASSWLYFGEEINGLQLLGSALILCGVWFIGTATTRTPHAGATTPAKSTRLEKASPVLK
jgi:drug/metabolite transporter (DMT)-like permease